MNEQQSDEYRNLEAVLKEISAQLDDLWTEYSLLEGMNDFYNMKRVDREIEGLEREYEDALDAMYSK